MRRVLAISLAILVVSIAARGVMAQETQQDSNDLLLKILKERNVLTDSEYQEIKGQLAQNQSAVDGKLTALDRSLADYLAKAGDTAGGNTSYVKNKGVTFSSGDGMWSVYFGGLFQFGYVYATGDNVDPNGGFELAENRIDFGGTIFDPNMTFYVQFCGKTWGGLDSDSMNYPGENGTTNVTVEMGGVNLMDAWVDYKICSFAYMRAGLMKIVGGRQHLVDQSDRAFGRINTIYGGYGPSSFSYTGGGELRPGGGRDLGVMFHNVADLDDNADGMKIEWMAGLWNGMGGNASFSGQETWLKWGARLVFFPMGYIDYVEGDWAGGDDPKFGIGGSFVQDQYHADSPADNPKNTVWQIDFVLTWMGIYLTGEYHAMNWDNGTTDVDDTAWFVQGGYFVMPGELEVLLKYSMVKLENDNEYSEIAGGVAFYFDGHEWKVVLEGGQVTSSPDGGKDTDDMFIRLVLQADW